MESNPLKPAIAFSIFFFFSINLFSQEAFISSWRTTQAYETIQIPTQVDSGYLYKYEVDWGDGIITNGHTTDASHYYINPGTYQISISGIFPAISFNKSKSSNTKIISIDQWGTQEWLSMEGAFYNCFNLEGQATDVPNLSKVTNLSGMFYSCIVFNQNIGNWDVSNVTNTSEMFAHCRNFNRDISNWDVSNVTDMRRMFLCAESFNQDIGNWDVSNVTDMSAMFAGAESFNQDIGDWDVSNVKDMSAMFHYGGFLFCFKPTAFNQDISNWDVSNVIDMWGMFLGAKNFNRDIGSWDVSKVENMERMFTYAFSFNQDIGSWDVGNVTNMKEMFAGAKSFNQDISNWNVSAVETMSRMFSGWTQDDSGIYPTIFNQDIGNWNTGNVTDMSGLFFNAHSFNQDIGDWDVSNVTDMSKMFAYCHNFDQDLGEWEVSKVTDMGWMFNRIKLSTENYDSLLIGWSSQNLQPNVYFDGGFSTYCKGDSACQKIMELYHWYIEDGGKDEACRSAIFHLSYTPILFQFFPNPTSGVVHLPNDFPIDQIAQIFSCNTKGKIQDVKRLSENTFILPEEKGLQLLILEMKNGNRYIKKVMHLH